METIVIPRNAPGQRFGHALAIQQGASNPIAVSRALVAAIYELFDEGTAAINTDPAVRLIAHQLAFLLGVGHLNDISEYDRVMAACGDRNVTALETLRKEVQTHITA